MSILRDRDVTDHELLVYTMTLLNKTLNGIPDQDTYYDVVDALEAQEMEDICRRLQQLGNKELTEQCRIYEAVLSDEDGQESPRGNMVVKR